VAALDFTLGCSGFVYGLGLAKGMIESGQVNNVLMLTADTYSKFIHPDDRSVRSLFGDGGAATLIAGKVSPEHLIGPFVYGTDGSGAEHLIVRGSGARSGGGSPAGQLCMNGPEIFNFTLEAVPTCVKALLARANVSLDVVDLFVFHQANAYMLEHLRLKLELPAEKFFVFLENCGNTVSSSIPIAIKEAMLAGRLRPGMTVMLVGFGVGLSWAATIVKW
jgi:3-oxoacyl-[acyl-carrier-protein] synthase-3